MKTSLNQGTVDDSAKISTVKVNGERHGSYVHELDVGEDGIPGVEGSISSDTDNGKIDTADVGQKDTSENQDQTRPNSLKKAATFKPVSVTKNFLAKTGTASVPASKISGDKGMEKS